MLGPVAGGVIVGLLHWRVIFFLNIPIGLTGLWLVYRHLPDYRERALRPLDVEGLIMFGSGVALLSYVLEIFGEHALRMAEILGLLGISVALLAGYAVHAKHTPFPLLRLNLLQLRTFGTSVAGSFVTRIGIGGAPFLLPLLYQIGLGFTAIQSGLLIMPQAIAAMGSKFFLSRILTRVGYRGVLISNTVALGVLLFLFGTIDQHTPVWVIVVQALCYGTCTSLQYTSMNTLVFADVNDEQTSSASTIVSTLQQLSISFGVAAAGLTTAVFIPDRSRASPQELIHGTHRAFLVLGIFTMLSTVVFRTLRIDDGANISQHKEVHAA